MKKIMIVSLVLALVAPAIADPNAIDVNLTCDGLNVTLSYSGAAADANRPRVWGLVITCDNGVTMSDFTAVKIGESTSGSPGYGIFPSTIMINSSGTVTGWSSPAYSGEGTGTVVVELGSLYSGDSNAPATSGDLLTFTVSGDCNVSVEENAADGGVLDEKGRPKHPHMHPCYSPVPCCCGPCPLDISGWEGEGIPDGYIGPEDLTTMLNVIANCYWYAYYCDVGLTPAEACLDVSGWEGEGIPDGFVGPEDLTTLLNTLGDCSGSAYYCECP